ncbi:MAG: TlpA disulfide reductase family protein [Bacteroidota bacterium]
MHHSKILFLFFACFLLACQEVKTQADPSAPKPTMTEQQEVAKPQQRQRGNMIISQARPANKINQQFPYDIELKSADGNIHGSETVLPQNDKPTVLLFWLTTCHPCRMEMAAIQKEYDRWQSEADFNLVAISTDFQKNFSRFSTLVEKQQWPWPAFNDHKREFSQIMPGRLNGLPQTFLLDPQGNILYHKRKYSPGDEALLLDAIKKANKG